MPDPIILGNLPAATAPLVGSEAVPCDQLVGSPVAATALVVGLGYRIVSVGTTNWQACGVPAGTTPAVGLQFVCSAAGTGTGTAQQVATVRATPDQIAARAAGAIGSAINTHLADPTAHAAAIGAEVAAQIAAITHLDASITGAVTGLVRNNTGGTLPAGTPCRFGAAVGGSDTFDLVVSRGDTPTTLPAAGVLEVALATGASGHLIRLGPCQGVNTSGMTAGADLWVGQAGGFTTTAPTGIGQRIGSVGKVHASNGSINVQVGTVTSAVARSGSFEDLTDEPVLPSQAEAEAGTAETARLWSSLRGRQAVAAWWLTVSGAVGRSLAGAATAAAARTTLELGDSATRNVGSAANTVAAGDAPAAAATAAAAAAQAVAIQRSNHTGTQPANTITGLSSVATSGAYGDLSGRPSLGTAAAANIGTTAGTVAAGDDSRLSNARTPTAHASTHATGGADALTPGAIGAELAGAAAAAVGGHVAALPHLSPGGSAGQAQLRNAAGGFGGASGLTVDEPTGRLTLASFLPGAAPAAPASGFTLFADSSGRFAWQRVGGNSFTIDATGFTAARVITAPDRSGTVALVGDSRVVSTLTPSAGVYTIDVTTTGQQLLKLGTINGIVSINIANGITSITSSVPANIPAGTMWEALIEFTYTSGSITFLAANTGITLFRWSPAITFTAGKTYQILLSHEPGASVVGWRQVGESQ